MPEKKQEKENKPTLAVSFANALEAKKSSASKPVKTAQLKEQLVECQKQQAEYLAGWQRAKADFLNYKKSVEEKSQQEKKCLNQDWALKILTACENFERAADFMPEDLENNDCVKGLLCIGKQLQDILKQEGVEPIEALGKQFDPETHEAVEVVESNKAAGAIIEVVRKGYKLNGRVLLPAKVKVVK